MKKQIWELEDLPELKVGDCLAFKAEGKWIHLMRLIGAETFHWAMVGAKIDYASLFESVSGTKRLLPPYTARDIAEKLLEVELKDYQVVDSTSKGITHHLLSEYQHRHMRVYRPKYPPEVQEALAPLFLWRYLYYGDQRYDNKGVLMVGWWWLLNHVLGIKKEWWVHDASEFWCLEFDEIIHRDFGLQLVPEGEPAYPRNMEQSKNLEPIWRTF